MRHGSMPASGAAALRPGRVAEWEGGGGAPVARSARRGAVQDGRAERGRGGGGGGQRGEAVRLAAVREDLLAPAQVSAEPRMERTTERRTDAANTVMQEALGGPLGDQQRVPACW